MICFGRQLSRSGVSRPGFLSPSFLGPDSLRPDSLRRRSFKRDLLWRDFLRDERGAVVVDHIPVFFVVTIIVMVIMELGIAHFLQLRAQKAVQLGARIAATMPAAAPGVPTINEKVDPAIGRGFPCFSSVGTNNCVILDQRVWQCTGMAECTGNGGVTMARIVNDMRRVDPSIQESEVRVTYVDHTLGNAGGPFIPQINVSIGQRSYDFAILSLGGGQRQDNPSPYMVNFVADFETHEATLYSGVTANAFGERMNDTPSGGSGVNTGTPPSDDDS